MGAVYYTRKRDKDARRRHLERVCDVLLMSRVYNQLRMNINIYLAMMSIIYKMYNIIFLRKVSSNYGQNSVALGKRRHQSVSFYSLFYEDVKKTRERRII